MRCWAVGLLLLGAFAASAAEFPPEQIEFFEKEVRPLLVKRCGECHGAEAKEAAGGLRLTSHAAVLAGGDTGPAVDLENPEKSLLLDAVNYGDLYQMPPKSKLPASEIAVLTKWVKLGAPWTKVEGEAAATAKKKFNLAERKASHWAWQPVERPEVPQVKDANWPADDIDRFILAKLEAKDLTPSTPADRRTLIRRLYFDLIGLPPTPEQVRAFVEDQRPNAVERVVDELLDSPHFGERWGRHWLDLMRYAESRGHEFDFNAPNAWQYRDYVVRAFNADVPYNDFAREHVAGDLLPEPRLDPETGRNESIIGTGFWFLGEWVHSPVEIRADECDRFDNMIDTFSKSFLGLTVSCARCHDHKFDAIRQADFYALQGYLQSSAFRLARIDSLHQNRRVAAKWSDEKARRMREFGAAWRDSRTDSLAGLRTYLLGASAALRQPAETHAELARERKLDELQLARWIAELKAAEQDVAHPLHAISAASQAFAVDQAQAKLAEFRQRRQGAESAMSLAEYDGELIVDYRQADAAWLQDGSSFGPRAARPGDVRLGGPENPIASIVTVGAAERDPFFNGLKLAPGSQLLDGGFRHDGAGKTIRTPTFVAKSPTIWMLVAGQGRSTTVVNSHRTIHGPLHGGLARNWNHPIHEWRWQAQDIRRYPGHDMHVELAAIGDQPMRVLLVAQGERPPFDPKMLAQPLIPAGETADALIGDLVAGCQEAAERFAQATLTDAEQPRKLARLLDWMLAKPELFPAQDDTAVRRAGAALLDARDELAGQLRRESQLAMAMWDGDSVNERLLIRGNFRAPADEVPRGLPWAIFGEQPVPAAGSGRRAMAERLVDAEQNPFISRVAVNRIWHHLFGRGIVPSVDNFGVLGQPPTHPELLDYLAAEFVADGWSIKRMIRRIVLTKTYGQASPHRPEAAAIDPTNQWLHRMPIRRLQAEVLRDAMLAISGRLDPKLGGPSVPVYLTSFMQGRGRPRGGPLDGAGRRTIYISVRRNFLSPMLLAFDFPQPAASMGRRNVSNVPQQALILMNHPLAAESANRWAERAIQAEADPGDRIERLYEQAFARPPSAEERERAADFLATQAREYGLAAADNDRRVWADLCHVLMNVKEFIYLR